ncbi:MAG: tRNA (adenosine(37)-N6)-threonylcarbamoyltransferase complex dimerization subunit type 1 TsaB [Planctomycetota bacterium]|jgi:tRNA threonylcarbamoyl adenosine modification protein YeaZ
MDADGLRLAIETSNPSASVEDNGSVALGVVSNGELVEELALERLDIAHRQDVELVPAIERALRRGGRTPGDLRSIAVSCGPGGYTSIRVGMACATSMAIALGIGCVGVPTSSVAALGARTRGIVARDEAVGVSLSSKGESSWYAIADPREAVAQQIGVHDESSFLDALESASPGVRTLVADDHWPESHKRAAHERGWRVGTLVLDASLCLRASSGHDVVHPANLAPIYPREPEAVKLWRTRND